MLITDRILYLDLHKTGCTHTSSILSEMFADSYTIIGKHNTYDTIPKEVLGDFEEKLKIGNIRNPWDWYVSLWAFGCGNVGALHNRLTRNRFTNFSIEKVKHLIKISLRMEYSWLKPEIWRELYSDSNNYKNFNKWLQLILSREKFEIGEGYKIKKLSKFAGLLTYRYITLYTYRKQFENIDSLVALNQYDSNENFMDVIIKNESIHEDLAEFSKKINYNIDDLNNILKNHQKRTNKSSRDRDYRKYYKDESILLVEKHEKFIINKYGYQF